MTLKAHSWYDHSQKCWMTGVLDIENDTPIDVGEFLGEGWSHVRGTFWLDSGTKFGRSQDLKMLRAAVKAAK